MSRVGNNAVGYWGAPKVMRGAFDGGSVVACEQPRLLNSKMIEAFPAGKLATEKFPGGFETLASTRRLSQSAIQQWLRR